MSVWGWIKIPHYRIFKSNFTINPDYMAYKGNLVLNKPNTIHGIALITQHSLALNIRGYNGK